MHLKWRLYSSHLGNYMRRWIARFPWGTLRVHNIRESDAGRDFHDHPFDFTSVILKGGYVEHRPGCQCFPDKDDGETFVMPSCRRFTAPAIVRRKAEDFHRLELINGSPAWTFVISGPYHREWGFLLGDGSWQHYREYHRSYYAEGQP